MSKRARPKDDAALGDTERLLLAALDHIDVGLILWDSQDRLVHMNRRFLELVPQVVPYAKPGVHYADYMRAIAMAGVAAEPVDDIDAWLERQLERHHQPSSEREFERGGRVLLLSKRRLPDGSATATWIDVTEARRREERLRHSEERLRDFAEAASEWLWETDSDLRYTLVEGDFPAIPEMDAAGVMGKTWQELAAAATDADVLASHGKTLAEHLPFASLVYRRHDGDGRTRHLRESGKPIFTPDGIFLGYRGVGIDITALVEAERQVRAAQERLGVAIDGLSDFLTLYDSEDRLILANRAAREINSEIAESLEPGRTYEDYIRAGIASGLFPGDGTVVDDGWIADRLRRHRESAGAFETVHRDDRWFLVNKQQVVDGMTLTIGTDITEQKRQSLRVETLNAELRAQIAETEHARARMRQAKELAEAASRAKSEFLSHMSHELRTPLNAVLGFAQLLQSDAEATMSEDQKSYLDFIIDGGRHLLTLINDVLDLSRIESGKLDLTIEPVRPADIYRDCLAMLEPLSDKHDITVTNRVGDAGEVAIAADPTRLKQVFLNIVSNAIKYNRRGGSVTITAGPAEPGMMRLSVADSGRGIAAERQTDVFQPFSRLLDDSAEIEGTGIGLAISRHLIDMMRGRLDFESELGIGSTFWFDLPIAGED